jgi:hypothetical protein
MSELLIDVGAERLATSGDDGIQTKQIQRARSAVTRDGNRVTIPQITCQHRPREAPLQIAGYVTLDLTSRRPHFAASVQNMNFQFPILQVYQ